MLIDTDRRGLLPLTCSYSSTQPAFWDALEHANTIGLDDRKLLASFSLRRGQHEANERLQLEKVLVLMARFKDEQISMQIQRYVIDLRKSTHKGNMCSALC